MCVTQCALSSYTSSALYAAQVRSSWKHLYHIAVHLGCGIYNKYGLHPCSHSFFSYRIHNSLITSLSSKQKKDREVQGVVLASGLPKIFSAGLDIREMYDKDEAHLRNFWGTLQVRSNVFGRFSNVCRRMLCTLFPHRWMSLTPCREALRDYVAMFSADLFLFPSFSFSVSSSSFFSLLEKPHLLLPPETKCYHFSPSIFSCTLSSTLHFCSPPSPIAVSLDPADDDAAGRGGCD